MEHIGKQIGVSLINKNKRVSTLHSEAHLLADEITQAWKEPKKFGMYLGVIKRLGVKRARQVFSDINQQIDLSLSSKAKLFMWHAKKAPEKV